MQKTGVFVLALCVAGVYGLPSSLPCDRAMDGTAMIMGQTPTESDSMSIDTVGGQSCGGTVTTGTAHAVEATVVSGRRWAMEAVHSVSDGASFDTPHTKGCASRTTNSDDTPTVTFTSAGTVTMRLVSAEPPASGSGVGLALGRSADCTFTVVEGTDDGENEDEDVDAGVKFGDEICVVGYIMDNFCIERGTLLDKSGVKTLEGPDQHSFHCLVDVSQCHTSLYEVLVDKGGDSPDTYCRGFSLGATHSATARTLAAQTGRSGDGCTECTNTASDAPSQGFRATIKGTFGSHPTASAAGTMTVTSVEAAAVGCGSIKPYEHSICGTADGGLGGGSGAASVRVMWAALATALAAVMGVVVSCA